MEGFIKLHRQISEHEFWLGERFTKGQAWIDLLLLANHKDGSFWIRGIEILVKRGEVARSMQTLAERWKWNRKTVGTFVMALNKRKMVVSRTDNKTTIILICNYEKYQQQKVSGTGQQSIHQNGQQSNTKTDTYNKKKNIKNEKEDTTNVVQPSAEREQYGNQEVNDLLEVLKSQIGIEDFKESRRMQRFQAYNILRLGKKIGKESFAARLGGILSDPFKFKNANSLTYLYKELKAFNVTAAESGKNFVSF